MERLTLEEFEARCGEFDARVQARPDIDQFCSSSPWVLSADRALMPGREPWIWRGEHGTAALMADEDGDGARCVQPLEALWGFACPFAGADAAALAREFEGATRGDAWDLMLLGGLVQGSALFEAMAGVFSSRHRVGLGPVTRRHGADLSRGFEEFMARRPAKLRKSLRAAQRRASGAGVTFEAAHPASPEAARAAYERVLAVEARSWKGRAGSGIGEGGMREFYRLMLPRLAARGSARLLFARHGEKDVAYILGGVFGGTYRGLQFSYDDDYAAYSLGNLAQLEQVKALCAEGIGRYDLGQENPYKDRWGELHLDTVMLVVSR
jgi:hypothetical protein